MAPRRPHSSGERSIAAADTWRRLESIREVMRRRGAGVCPVRPRLLRQIVRADREVLGLDVPHADCYVVPLSRLRKLVDQEGYLLDLQDLPDPAILVAEPSVDELHVVSDEALACRMFALEYHARIHATLEARAAEGQLDAECARRCFSQIGRDETAEAVLALEADNRLLPPRDPVTELIELAATYLEYRCFAPELLRSWFPSLEPTSFDAALESLHVALSVPALFGEQGSRVVAPYVAPDIAGPHVSVVRTSGERQPASGSRGRRLSDSAVGRVLTVGLMARADRATRVGNNVRAAILRHRAQRWRGSEPVRDAQRSAGDADIRRLSERIVAALGHEGPAVDDWYDTLRDLLHTTERTVWAQPTKLLYDLQKACVDAERPGFGLDLLGWVRSRGRAPLERTLDRQVLVRVHRHLRTALSRIRKLEVGPKLRTSLLALLRLAEGCAAERICSVFRPILTEALSEVGLRPKNLPEEVAGRKVVEGLLDRICNRDYISFSDLRDEISQQSLKMQDMTSVFRLIGGDALLMTDRLLAKRLEGVYRSTAIYMRLLQRLSSLAFGTRTGRQLTRYVALPFGGAFVILEGLHHLLAPIARWTALPEPHLVSYVSVLSAGFIVLAHLRIPSLRHLSWRLLKIVLSSFRSVFTGLPLSFVRLPMVRRLLDSYWFAITRRFVIKPLAPVTLMYVLMPVAGIDRRVGLPALGGLFVATNVLVNSRVGRELEAHLGDGLALFWGRIRRRLLPNLFRFVMETSRRVLGMVERLAYTVDELLRFRRGDRRFAIAAKLVGGSIWSSVIYVFQLYVNLLVEPQINPIKHFPVVTVSHKIILPATPTLVKILRAPLVPIVGKYIGNGLAGMTVFLLPGLFGFLVWELTANWKLYEASRPRRLGPIAVGSHGETVAALLRPGFHSGTIPKLYNRLRRRATHAYRTGQRTVRPKEEEELHHVATALRRFVDRELITLLDCTPGFSARLRVGRIHLGTTQIRIAILSDAGSPLELTFSERNGRLFGRVHRGFAKDLPSRERGALSDGLLGLLKRTQLDTLERDEPPSGPFSCEVGELVVTWADWVERWERDRAGEPVTPLAESISALKL
ncbi:hypothetical protein ACFL59_06525 [Planctomycetota bacterium]